MEQHATKLVAKARYSQQKAEIARPAIKKVLSIGPVNVSSIFPDRPARPRDTQRGRSQAARDPGKTNKKQMDELEGSRRADASAHRIAPAIAAYLRRISGSIIIFL